MRYELWEMVSMGEGEQVTPMFLNMKSEDYEKVYVEFQKLIKQRPCAILLEREN